jgi:hypothetical protein
VPIKIGKSFTVSKGAQVQYIAQAYRGGSIGIRGRIKSGENVKPIEEALYSLREGSVQDVEIEMEDGNLVSGEYKINELNWKKERQPTGDYELMFNIGLQQKSP